MMDWLDKGIASLFLIASLIALQFAMLLIAIAELIINALDE